jgi:hypothetical protein
MRRFATTFALLTIALSTAACEPYRAFTNALPEGCNPNGNPQLAVEPASDTWSAHPAPTLPGPHQKGVTSQHEDVRPAEPPATGSWY